MLAHSDEYSKFSQHCVRRPAIKLYADWDKDGTYDNSTCDVVAAEWVNEIDSPVSSVVKSYADITFSNTNSEYYYFGSGQLVDCNGDPIPETISTKDVRPSVPIKIESGFRYPDISTCDECGLVEDTIQVYCGSSEKFPSYTMEDGGRSLAMIHFTDSIDTFASSIFTTDMTFTNQTSGQVLTSIASVFGYTIVIPDMGSSPISFTISSGDTVEDWLKYITEIDGGRFYQDADCQLHYETQSYIAGVIPSPVMSINTCDHVIDTSTPALGNIYNYVKVQQFTNAGGVEYTAIDQTSIDQYGLKPLTVTNPLVTTENSAQIIANRILSFYSQGTDDREITVVGLPQLEVNDRIYLRERITNKTCIDCGCYTLYSEQIWRINRTYNRIDETGHTTKLTLTKSPLILNPFVFCESDTCNNQIGIIC